MPELAPTAWVTVDKTTPVDIDVWSLTAQPADYVLHVYDWDSQAGQAAEASSTPRRRNRRDQDFSVSQQEASAALTTSGGGRLAGSSASI